MIYVTGSAGVFVLRCSMRLIMRVIGTAGSGRLRSETPLVDAPSAYKLHIEMMYAVVLSYSSHAVCLVVTPWWLGARRI